MGSDCRLDPVSPKSRPDDRTDPRPDAERRAGLCASCRCARVARNRRGNEFWRCLRSDRDPRFARYPATPVRRCAGHDPGLPEPDR